MNISVIETFFVFDCSRKTALHFSFVGPVSWKHSRLDGFRWKIKQNWCFRNSIRSSSERFPPKWICFVSRKQRHDLFAFAGFDRRDFLLWAGFHRMSTEQMLLFIFALVHFHSSLLGNRWEQLAPEKPNSKRHHRHVRAFRFGRFSDFCSFDFYDSCSNLENRADRLNFLSFNSTLNKQENQ